MKQTHLTVLVFALLSFIIITLSDALFKVHAIDVSALLFAFCVPGLVAINKGKIAQLQTWLFGALIGLLYWDAASAVVIAKREMFMGWYIVYPIGAVAIVSLQSFVKYINSKLPYNKRMQQDAVKLRR
jgi:hypothetical protein